MKNKYEFISIDEFDFSGDFLTSLENNLAKTNEDSILGRWESVSIHNKLDTDIEITISERDETIDGIYTHFDEERKIIPVGQSIRTNPPYLSDTNIDEITKKHQCRVRYSGGLTIRGRNMTFTKENFTYIDGNKVFKSIKKIEYIEETSFPYNKCQMLFLMNGFTIDKKCSKQILTDYIETDNGDNIVVKSFIKDNIDNIELLNTVFEKDNVLLSKFIAWAVGSGFLVEKLTTWQKTWRFLKKQYKLLAGIIGVVGFFIAGYKKFKFIKNLFF
jgi:hypothetical protein